MNLQPHSAQWLSAYLYYAGSKEELLLHLWPTVDQMLFEKLIHQFFFVRYYDRGPHLRLRLKLSEASSEEVVKQQLQETFNNFLLTAPPSADKTTIDEPELPSNTIYYVAYQPEMLRYGGPEGIVLSETQFDLSSRVVISILQQSGAWGYGKALGAALTLHLITLRSLAIPVEQLIDCCNLGQASWITYSINTDFEPVDEKTLREKIDDMTHSYTQQKGSILPILNQVWQTLDDEAPFEEEHFNHWTTSMKSIVGALKKTITDQPMPDEYYVDMGLQPLSAICPSYWPIIDSYIHMTNNRLGILNRDEGFLYYILKEFLQDTHAYA